MRNPSGKLLLSEIMADGYGGTYFIWFNSPWSYINDPHNNSSNNLWLDGHVANLKDPKSEFTADLVNHYQNPEVD